MKQKLFVFSAVLAITLSALTGCFKQGGTGGSALQSESGQALASESFDRHDGLPPLNNTLKEVYKKAAERYVMITYMQLKTDEGDGENGPAFTEIDGVEDYVRVTDDRFSSVAALKVFLAESFTDDYLSQNWFAANSQMFHDYNGGLYVLTYGNSPNERYRGQTFTVTKAAENEIDFTAHIYDEKADGSEPADAPVFFSEPSNPQDYTVTDVPFSMMKGDDGVWRFRAFSDVYPIVLTLIQ